MEILVKGSRADFGQHSIAPAEVDSRYVHAVADRSGTEDAPWSMKTTFPRHRAQPGAT